MKLNNKKVKKILLPILLGVTLIFAGFKYQANKINDLQQQLDSKTLHVEQDSIQLINSSTYSSWFADKEDNRIAMNEFTQSFEKEAAKRIDKYYKEEVKNHMPYQAKVQVKKLVGSFIRDKEIIVEVKLGG